MSAPLPVTPARDQRLQDRLVGVHARADVDHGCAHARRRLGSAGDGGQPRLRLDQQIVGLAVAIGPFVAVARDRAADEPRKPLAQGFHRIAELGQGAGLQVLHEHVGLGHDRLEQALAVRPGEVGDDRLLAAVEPHEVRAQPVDERVVGAREIALGPLQLDHPRPGVGQLAARHRRGNGLVEREHQRSCEWLGHYIVRSKSFRRLLHGISAAINATPSFRVRKRAAARPSPLRGGVGGGGIKRTSSPSVLVTSMRPW